MTHSKDRLAEALRAVGLDTMAREAASGYYHDFLSPLDTPALQLVNNLMQAAMLRDNNQAILALRERVIMGDFDASQEEGDEWAASPEGQAAFRRLMPGGGR
jgi:hypothetical protein